MFLCLEGHGWPRETETWMCAVDYVGNTFSKENHCETVKILFYIYNSLAFLSGISCAATATQESTGQYVDDSVITTKVKTAIFNEPSIGSAEINVGTYKGVVQLSGFVSSQSDINKSAAVARSVIGVRSVKNDMQIK